MAFFASPAKAWLNQQLNKRNTPALQRTASQESMREPLMGLPNDPGQDFDEVVQEVRDEVERRRKGSGRRSAKSVGQEAKEVLKERTGMIT